MRALFASFVLLALAGCATGGPSYTVDEQYVAKAERSARLGGAQLYWIHKPEIPAAPQEIVPQQPQS